MIVLAVVGSPRKAGNTDLLVEQILAGSRTNGHASNKLYLYDYEISPCIDCRNCKKGDYVCTLDDEMQLIYPKIHEANVIIFGTPVYWYGPTGKMKLFVDRLRPFVASGKLKGKKGIVVTPSAEGPGACEPLIRMFRMSFDYLGMEFGGEFLATAYEKGEISENREVLQRAYEFGANSFRISS